MSSQMSMEFQRHLTNINIVEKSCGNKPNKIGTTLGSLNDSYVIDRIIESYENYPSVLKKLISKINFFSTNLPLYCLVVTKVHTYLKNLQILAVFLVCCHQIIKG